MKRLSNDHPRETLYLRFVYSLSSLNNVIRLPNGPELKRMGISIQHRSVYWFELIFIYDDQISIIE